MISFESKLNIPEYVSASIKGLLQSVFDFDMVVQIKKKTNRRSLDANAYLWVLLQKMADGLSTPKNRVDKWDVYLLILESYGVFTHIIVKPSAVERMKQEYRACKELGEVTVGSMTGIQLQCYYGSSSYDTAEMARLIDGVITECKQMGIETLPPDEIERMKREWGVEIEEKNESIAV